MITETISANPALDKTFCIYYHRKIDWYRVVTMLTCIMGETREGKRFVMTLSWVEFTVRVCEDILPKHGTTNWKNADYFAAIGLMAFCDIV